MPYFPDDPAVHAKQRTAVPATLPATFGEFAGASANAFLHTNRSISKPWLQHQEHEKVMDAYRSITGKEFRWTNRGGRLDSGAPAFDHDAKRFWKAMSAEIEANPALREALPATSHEQVKERLFQIMRDAEAQAQEVGARASGVAQLGGFAGGLAAAVTDPPVAASLFFGAALGTSVLRGAMIEASIGAGSEAVVQAFLQGQRKEAGLEHGLDQALAAIGIAGAGGAAIYGVGGMAVKALRGDSQQLAYEQIIKRQHQADTQPAPNIVSPQEHRRRLDQALFDIEEGRAVNVDAVPELASGRYLADLDEISARLDELGRIGLPVDELVPTLPRAMRAANEGVRIALSRDRVEALAQQAERAVGEEQATVARAREAEQAYLDAIEARSEITTAQIRNELARAGGREAVVGTLDRSTRRELNRLESVLRDSPDAAARQAAGAERTRILDAARKRLSRETERLQRAADEAEARVLTTSVQRSEADTAMRRALDARRGAERNIATEIGGALSDSDIRRLYRDRAEGVVEAGPEPAGMAARDAVAARRSEAVEEQTTGPMAQALQEDQIRVGREIAEQFADSDIEFELPDGTIVRASEAWQRVDESDAGVREMEACIRGG